MTDVAVGYAVEDHTALFAKNSDAIGLEHMADPRDVPDLGCVGSIRLITDRKNGKVHSMDEVLRIC